MPHIHRFRGMTTVGLHGAVLLDLTCVRGLKEAEGSWKRAGSVNLVMQRSEGARGRRIEQALVAPPPTQGARSQTQGHFEMPLLLRCVRGPEA